MSALALQRAAPGRRSYDVEITAEERLRGVVRVRLYTSDGRPMQVKKGLLHRGRCTVKWLGRDVEASQVGGRWVFRVPAMETAA